MRYRIDLSHLPPATRREMARFLVTIVVELMLFLLAVAILWR